MNKYYNVSYIIPPLLLPITKEYPRELTNRPT